MYSVYDKNSKWPNVEMCVWWLRIWYMQLQLILLDTVGSGLSKLIPPRIHYTIASICIQLFIYTHTQTSCRGRRRANLSPAVHISMLRILFIINWSWCNSSTRKRAFEAGGRSWLQHQVICLAITFDILAFATRENCQGKKCYHSSVMEALGMREINCRSRYLPF